MGDTTEDPYGETVNDETDVKSETVKKDESADDDKDENKEDADENTEDADKNKKDADKKMKDADKNKEDADKNEEDTDKNKEDADQNQKPANEEDELDEDGRPPVDDTSPTQSMADPNEEAVEECKEGETCPQIIKSISEQYIDYRETAKTMIYLIDCRDRAKIFKWICKLDTMEDEDGQLERLMYIKYLVQTLSEPYGLVEPFTSYPPDRLKPLRNVLAPVIFADLLEEQPDKCFDKRRPEPTKKDDPAYGPVQDDKKFYNQQLFPPEGLVCYAVAFSTL